MLLTIGVLGSECVAVWTTSYSTSCTSYGPCSGGSMCRTCYDTTYFTDTTCGNPSYSVTGGGYSDCTTSGCTPVGGPCPGGAYPGDHCTVSVPYGSAGCTCPEGCFKVGTYNSSCGCSVPGGSSYICV